VSHQVSVEGTIAEFPSSSTSSTEVAEASGLDHVQVMSRWRMVSAGRSTRKRKTRKTTLDSKAPVLERVSGDGGSEWNAREHGDDENRQLANELCRSVFCVGPGRST
jgi:hypothetical protein